LERYCININRIACSDPKPKPQAQAEAARDGAKRSAAFEKTLGVEKIEQ
jgi:hypothetical protein